MKKNVLIKILSFVVFLGLVKSSVVLAKQEPKKVEKEQEEKLSPKEEKEKEIKTIKEVLKKYDSLEQQIQKKLLEMFKNFKKEDYEVENYDLEVFKKNNAPILVYTHKKTGAQVFFNLNLKKDKSKFCRDRLIFKVPLKDNSGLTEFSNNCVANPFSKEFGEKFKISPEALRTYITAENLNFVLTYEAVDFNEKLEKEYVKSLSKKLRKPDVFKKGDLTFEVEKKKLLNQTKDSKFGEYSMLDYLKVQNIRNYNFSGEVLELEKTTLKDFKNFYEKYVNPSNCLLIKNVFELNPQKIKDYLNLWHENYFSYFEKKEIKDNCFELKNKEKYLFNSWAKDSNFFNFYNNKKKKTFNFFAYVHFDEKIFKEKQKEIFKIGIVVLEKELDALFKSLGYEKGFVSEGMLYFYGSEKNLFSQKALEENSKKIMNFIAEKFKSLNEEDYLCYRYHFLKSYDESEINKKTLKNSDFLWSYPNIYKGEEFSNKVITSFNETKKAISSKNFIIKDKNEIESFYELTDKNIKQSLKEDSNFYKVSAKNGPSYIDVYERSNKKTLKQMFEKEKEKYEIIPRVVPIKFKEKSSKKFVRDFAILFLAKFLDEELSDKRGLICKHFKPSFCLEEDFLVSYFLNKESVKDLEDFIFKNFDEIIKNFKAKEKDLKELKKKYKENFELFKNNYEIYCKRKNKAIKDLKDYIKTKKVDNESEVKAHSTIKLFFNFYPTYLINEQGLKLFTLFSDFKDYDEFFEKEMAFKEKYKKMLNEKITPEFVKDFLENLLEPALKKLEKSYKLAKEKLKALDSIKLSDVKNLIKTAYLFEDKKQIKKVNQNIFKKTKREQDFLNKYFSNESRF